MDLCWQSNALLLNMLSRLVITFLPRSKRLLISWLHHHLQWLVSHISASQGVPLTFWRHCTSWRLLVLAPLVTAVSPCFFSHSSMAPLPDRDLYRSFKVFRLYLCLLLKMNLTEYSFFIVFVAFASSPGGDRDNSGLDHHVYYIRSPNWYFPNYLVRITLKNIFNLLIVWV